MSKSVLVHSAGQTSKKLQHGLIYHKPNGQCFLHGQWYDSSCKRTAFSTVAKCAFPSTHEQDRRPSPSVGTKIDHLAERAKEKLWDKEFFFDLLSSAVTKRDAKAYISRLKSPRKVDPPARRLGEPLQKPDTNAQSHGVNLGSFFGYGRAVEDRPLFAQHHDLDTEIEQGETTHVALVKIAIPQLLDENTIAGIAQTLSQLARLSMVPCVVLDTRPGSNEDYCKVRAVAVQQVHRLVEAIEVKRGATARAMESVLSLNAEGSCMIFSRKLLLKPLRQGRIPVIAPIAYEETTQQAVMIPADTAILALARELAGLTLPQPKHDQPTDLSAKYQALQRQISVDRIIVLDPTGPIHTPGPIGKKHVFINMEQEFDELSTELAKKGGEKALGYQETKRAKTVPTHETIPHSSSNESSAVHLQNLRLLQSILALLPPASSAIVTSPNEAAKSSQISQQVEQVSTVGTRRQKNPLIHNLLTDKPAHSSSLPPGRMGRLNASSSPPVMSTFVKKGMPLTIFPDPRITPWRPDGPRVNLHDPRIDLGRLVHLIEDSFNRPLDVNDYLSRVNDRIAGLIIAGNYEGGALFTWETPGGCSDTATDRLVPYLDKFAVLKRSQGAGGVADIVFNAMVRGCLPEGVCWRSRRDNPVNKWYFERARGTWKLPDENWTMFWTTEGVFDRKVGDGTSGRLLFDDYEAVCRNVKPSWADKKHIMD